MRSGRFRRAHSVWAALVMAIVGGPAFLAAGSRARAASGSPTPVLYYETQTGPRSFAIDALHLSAHPSSTQVVALRNPNVDGLAVSGQSIFWSTQAGPLSRGAIMRAPIDGGHARRLVGGLTEPASVVAVGRYVYWDDRRAIGRVSVSGAHPHRRFIALSQEAGGGVADGLASDGRHLFFSRCSDDTIGRADLNGRQIHQRFMTLDAKSCPQGLAVSAGHIFWTELGQGLIGRGSVGGGHRNPHWLRIKSRQGPFQIVVGDGHVYWAWGGENGSPSYTGRAGTDRSHLRRYFLPDSLYPMALTPGAGRVSRSAAARIASVIRGLESAPASGG